MPSYLRSSTVHDFEYVCWINGDVNDFYLTNPGQFQGPDLKWMCEKLSPRKGGPVSAE